VSIHIIGVSTTGYGLWVNVIELNMGGGRRDKTNGEKFAVSYLSSKSSRVLQRERENTIRYL